MNNHTLRILIVDDHAILRRGFRLVLEKLDFVGAVDEADTCASAMQQIAASPPNVVILDVHLPGMDGIEGARLILARHPDLKIIMLSADSNPELVVGALRAGAMAYVIKQDLPEEVERAIRAVCADQGYFSPEVAATLARYCRDFSLGPASAPKPALSEHELRLLKLVAEGKRNKEIAIELGVTTKSVEAYRSRLMAKLGYTTPAELTRFAIREGLLPP